MRVLLVNQAFYPDTVATAQHTTDLALYLKNRGYEVTVLCSRRAYTAPRTIFSKYEVYQGVHIYRAKGTGFGKGSFFLRVIDIFTLHCAMFVKLLCLRRHDTVIAFTSPPLVSFLAMMSCRLKGGILISWLMDINPDAAMAVGYLKPHWMVSRLLVYLFRRTLVYSRYVVVLDRWMREKLIRHGVNKEKVIIVPPWDVQDPGVFDRPDIRGPENPLRRENGLAEKFTILYSGNLSVVHPLTTLLEAAVLLKHDPNTVFLFVGSGLRSLEVERYRKDFGLTSILQLPYQTRNLLPYSLSCADVHVIVLGPSVAGFVHTSKVYGTLMTGVPFIAIAPEESHLGDLVKEVPGGFRVDHGDVRGFVRAIEQCRSMSVEEKTLIRQRQREFLLSNYALESLLQRFEVIAFKNPQHSAPDLAKKITQC